MPGFEGTLDRSPARRGISSLTETLNEPLARFRGEIDRLIDGFPSRWPSGKFPFSPGLLVPSLEMTETGKAFRLAVEVPGIEATDIEMHVHDGAIFLSGSKKERREEDEKGYSYSERVYGSFERRIEIPNGADATGIKAKIHNGVLEITIPKTTGAAGQRQRVDIESD
jgi:HSP20 family protein